MSEAEVSGIDELVARNAAFAASRSEGDGQSEPAMHVAIVGCMDARTNLGRILGLRHGEAHVLRNAGGVITDDTIRSLCLSQRFLGTREIMLLHHTDCGLQKFQDDDLIAELEAETGVRPPFTFGAFSDPYADVRLSIERLRESPFIQHRDRIRGFVYDVDDGLLHPVD